MARGTKYNVSRRVLDTPGLSRLHRHDETKRPTGPYVRLRKIDKTSLANIFNEVAPG